MNNNKFYKMPSKAYFENINKYINYAEVCIEVYFLLKFEDQNYENKKWNEVLEIAPVFWQVTIKSLLETSLLNLSGICEAYHKTIKFIDSQNDYFYNDDKTKQYKLCKKKMKKGVEILSGIDKIRDKTIAHFNPDYFENTLEIYQEAKLNKENLRMLIRILKEIHKDLLKLIFNEEDLPDVEVDTFPYGDYDDVAKLMIKCLNG